MGVDAPGNGSLLPNRNLLVSYGDAVVVPSWSCEMSSFVCLRSQVTRDPVILQVLVSAG